MARPGKPSPAPLIRRYAVPPSPRRRASASSIRRRLEIEQLRVAAADREQLLVRTLLDQAAVFKDQDAVGAADGREAVRDEDGRPSVGQLLQTREQLVLCLG